LGYDKKSDEILVKMPNLEIKIAEQNAVIDYDPGFKKRYSVRGTSVMRDLQSDLLRGDYRAAINILETFVFKPYQHPVHIDISPQEVSRRLEMILRAASVRNRVGVAFGKDTNP